MKILKNLLVVFILLLIITSCASLARMFGPAKRAQSGGMIERIENWLIDNKLLDSPGHIASLHPEELDLPRVDFYTVGSVDELECSLDAEGYLKRIIQEYKNKGASIVLKENSNLGGLEAKSVDLISGNLKIKINLAIHWQRPYWVVCEAESAGYDSWTGDFQAISKTVRFLPLDKTNSELIKRECAPFGKINGLGGIQCGGYTEDWTGDQGYDGIAISIGFLDESKMLLSNWYNTSYIVNIRLIRKKDGKLVYSDIRNGIHFNEFTLKDKVPLLSRIPASEIKGGFDSKNDRGRFKLEITLDTEKQGSFSSTDDNCPGFSILKSANADLKNIKVSAGSFEPAFKAATDSYELIVPNEAAEISLSLEPADNKIRRVDAKIDDGEWIRLPKDDLTLKLEMRVMVPRTIEVLIEAENETTKAYRINATRQLSDNADLSALVLSDGALAPEFAPQKIEYEVSVNKKINTIYILPQAANEFAQIAVQVNGGDWQTIKSDKESPVDLKEMENTLTIQITAQDGTLKTYQIMVKKINAWLVQGVINVPDPSYWEFVRVGVLFLSKDAGSILYEKNIFRTIKIMPPGKDVVTMMNIRYQKDNNGAPVEIPVGVLGTIAQKGDLTRSFEILLKIPEELLDSLHQMSIVAWYDNDLDGNWDVIDKQRISGDFFVGKQKGVVGSEYIRLPVLAKHVNKQKKERNMELGLFGLSYYAKTDKLSGIVHGIADKTSGNGNFENGNNLQDLTFNFESNTYEEVAE